MTILDDALGWHGAGCYVLPVRPDGSKAPGVTTWSGVAPAQQVYDVQALFDDTDGVGLVCGQPSLYLEMVEVEGRAVDTVGELVRLCEANSLGLVWAILENGYVEATPSGGIHWLFRTEGPSAPNTKLARRPGPKGPDVTWETRGQGGFVVVAPSNGRTHPTGRAWTTIVGSPATIPTLSIDERDALYAVVRMLDEMPPPEPIPTSTTRAASSTDELRPGDDYEARTSWGEILDGWTAVRRFSGGGIGWRRPGKDTPGISATTGMRADADRLYVFSSSTDFESERPYSKFGAFALLHFGGDHAAAARELRRQGYGAERPQSRDDDWSWAVPGSLASRPFPDSTQGSAVPAREESQVAVTKSDYGARLTKGGGFLFDSPPNPVPVWGDGAEVLWSQGEPCIITGPIGAGKTTLLGRLVHASLGLSRGVLDYPVAEVERVLYLASDRPRQISRNLRRMFDPADRDELDRRVVVWQGPPPMDVAKNPAILLELAHAAGATRVFVDGIKDIAAKISEEETGQGLNRAMQLLVVEGIDVVANHHQRKGEGGKATKPKSLDDVYGSTWLAAGAGTVLLVWADEAGSQAVEVSTIKPAADNVGPLRVLHETDTGRFDLDSEPASEDDPKPITGKNVTATLRGSRHTTLSARELMKALNYPEAKINKSTLPNARRALDRLVKAGAAAVHETSSDGLGGHVEKHFQWIGE